METVHEIDKTEQTGSFMANIPNWLKDIPHEDGTEYDIDCEVLVIGAGQCGSVGTLRLAEAGIDVLCLESQEWDKYDVYPTDMAVYNARIFLDRGVPEYDPIDIFNEYMNRALGHAHPQLVRDYAFRSGEMFDWLVSHIPEELTEKYGHPVNYRGNPDFRGEVCGQKNFIGTVQWRDNETNKNMWGYVMKHILQNASEKGARFMFGCRALRLIQDEDGTVTGCLALDCEGRQFIVHCKAVLMGAGDYGGNREMQIDLSDTLRNIAWSYGLDRTDPKNVMAAGRDGSGIKMLLWAGGTMEAGPRAGQACQMNKRPEFAFGGCWPCFGPDGQRFMNESLIRKGSYGVCDMLPIGGLITLVTDSNWDKYLDRQGYGHEMYDRSNDRFNEIVREDMRNYKLGPEGFPVHDFGRTGMSCETCYAANTIEELGLILGYSGDDLDRFVKAVDRYNEMCEKHKDTDWGCDPGYLFPIKDAPFFGCTWKTRLGIARGGLCQHGGVCTDGNYNVVNSQKQPIKGLYAAGNCCGQRYAVQYHTPTAGNSCGSALTSGYCAAEHIIDYLEINK